MQALLEHSDEAAVLAADPAGVPCHAARRLWLGVGQLVECVRDESGRVRGRRLVRGGPRRRRRPGGRRRRRGVARRAARSGCCCASRWPSSTAAGSSRPARAQYSARASMTVHTNTQFRVASSCVSASCSDGSVSSLSVMAASYAERDQREPFEERVAGADGQVHGLVEVGQRGVVVAGAPFDLTAVVGDLGVERGVGERAGDPPGARQVRAGRRWVDDHRERCNPQCGGDGVGGVLGRVGHGVPGVDGRPAFRDVTGVPVAPRDHPEADADTLPSGTASGRPARSGRVAVLVLGLRRAARTTRRPRRPPRLARRVRGSGRPTRPARSEVCVVAKKCSAPSSSPARAASPVIDAHCRAARKLSHSASRVFMPSA